VDRVAPDVEATRGSPWGSPKNDLKNATSMAILDHDYHGKNDGG